MKVRPGPQVRAELGALKLSGLGRKVKELNAAPDGFYATPDMAEPSAGGDAVSDSVRSVAGVGDKTAAYLAKFAIETVDVVA